LNEAFHPAENPAIYPQFPSSRRQTLPVTRTAKAAAKPAEKSAKMAGGTREPEDAQARRKPVLFHPCASPLDEQNQHDHEEHAGNNADDGYIVHFQLLLNLLEEPRTRCCCLGWARPKSPLKADLFPASELGDQASFQLRERCCSRQDRSSRRRRQPIQQNQALLDVGATALNQHSQHDHKQNAGDNPDHRYAVHLQVSLLSIFE
jgi:hypothetical protein